MQTNWLSTSRSSSIISHNNVVSPFFHIQKRFKHEDGIEQTDKKREQNGPGNKLKRFIMSFQNRIIITHLSLFTM